SGVGYIGKFYNYFLFVPYRDGANIKVKSRLSNEVATPGYYAATLQDYGSSFEVTARPFAACHRYGFPKGKGRIRIDVTHAGLEQCAMMSKSYRESVEEYELKESGTNAWRGRIRVNGIDLHFSIRAKDDIGISSCNEGVLDAQVEGDSAETFIGFSLTSAEEAEKRVEESQSVGFDKSYAEASDAWEAALSGIRVKFAKEAERRRFYSALYHSFIKPVDCGTGFVDYSTLWDIYKTQLPLVLSTQPQVARRLAMDMLAVSERYGFFPLTHMMTRNKGRDNGQAAALSVYSLADAFFRGALAKDDYVRMKAAFQNQIDGTKTDGKSPTYSLDLSGACRAAAFVADACGDAAYAEALRRKGEIWKTVYDSRTGYLVSNAKYYEGNYRNYSFRAHMGMGERVRMAGGVEKFAFMLDDFFRVGYIPEKWDPDRERVPRIGYFEGLNNESDMEAPYTYLWCGRADRMAEVLDLIRRCRFADGEGGCPGNNDSGGTSAWYAWSCLGLYPQTGTPYYLLGSPSVDRADVRLANGVLRILVERESRASVCPVGYELNGRRFTEPWVSVSELERGGTLQFCWRTSQRQPAVRFPNGWIRLGWK
ncbi:MAG: glycoside hydrolase family 92 protein, partial [bacterium]|nr:glycoside hydrolase family 92 protein [Candidatus Colisoma equi]